MVVALPAWGTLPRTDCFQLLGFSSLIKAISFFYNEANLNRVKLHSEISLLSASHAEHASRLHNVQHTDAFAAAAARRRGALPQLQPPGVHSSSLRPRADGEAEADAAAAEWIHPTAGCCIHPAFDRHSAVRFCCSRSW